MADLAAGFHAAQEAALRGSAALKTAMGLTTARIYTVVPKDVLLPYVLIGEDQVFYYKPPGGCPGEGEIFATVNWWSKPTVPDVTQSRAMGAAILAVLVASLTVTGHDVDDYELQDMTYATDPDGSTHGRAIFHYLTTEQVA
jgi:hypothetical protein